MKGMDADDVVDVWLSPGTSMVVVPGTSTSTYRYRIPVGNDERTNSENVPVQTTASKK